MSDHWSTANTYENTLHIIKKECIEMNVLHSIVFILFI
jgi:hypothetical protein